MSSGALDGLRDRQLALRRRERISYIAVVTGTFLLFVATWEIVGRLSNPLFFAPLSETIVEFVKAIGDPRGRLLTGFIETVNVLVPGYLISAGLGIVLGVLMGRSSILHDLLDPYVTILYNTPRVALIPILMLWLGIGPTMKVTIVVVAAVFPILVNTMAGIRDVSREFTEPALSYNATEGQLLRKVILPASLPFIVAGLKLGLGRAITTVIVAEFFVSVSGLGGLLYASSSSFQMARMFVPVIILALIGIVIDALLSYLERLASRRYGG